MPLGRRCLVPQCGCRDYRIEMTVQEDDKDFLEADVDELKAYCSSCGHAEEEHELAAEG